MKLALRLAYKNLIGAGLRTWLNVFVLSFSFVIIIFYNGFLNGWMEQASLDMINWEIGKGELHHDNYEVNDPFTIVDGHGIIPKDQGSNYIPILVRQGTIYPNGRMISITIKGIDKDQNTLNLPTYFLNDTNNDIPVIIGKRMAKASQLNVGDEVLMRWRDKDGTYDASKIIVSAIYDSNVAAIDNGQIWMDIEKLWQITGLYNHTSYNVATNENVDLNIEGWHFLDENYLLKDIRAAVQMERIGSMIIFMMLLAIALLAIFDTQVLSIFRRQREIGTYIALGMTRWNVVWLFTIEGAMYSFFATIIGCIYGIPIFIYIAKTGIGMAEMGDEMGFAMASRIFPIYGVKLILIVALLVVISATIVSFLPARKIAKLNPVDALKGKLQ